MVCKFCDHQMFVMESRKHFNQTYRRYKCPCCGRLIYTEESETKDAKSMITKIHRKYIRKSVDKKTQDMVN